MTDTPAPVSEQAVFKLEALNLALDFKEKNPGDGRPVVEIAQTFLSFLKGN